MAKVLLIEDDPLVLRMYEKVLKYAHFEVFTAEGGEEGLLAAKNNRPDLIFLDIMMPIMDGLEVLDRLKADVNTANVPVVMLTNLSGEKDAKVAMDKGALLYMVKSEYKPNDIADKAKEIIGADSQTS